MVTISVVFYDFTVISCRRRYLHMRNVNRIKTIFGILLLVATMLVIITSNFSKELYANPDTNYNAASDNMSKDARIPEYIDNVLIPGEVIDYVHLKYQGHAITQVIETIRDGEPVYILRVSSDTNPTYLNSVFLLYDAEWKLIGDETIQPPTPKNVSIPQTEPTITENGLPANTEPPTEAYVQSQSAGTPNNNENQTPASNVTETENEDDEDGERSNNENTTERRRQNY